MGRSQVTGVGSLDLGRESEPTPNPSQEGLGSRESGELFGNYCVFRYIPEQGRVGWSFKCSLG
ncbi:MAG: hypothetical protein F6J94_01420 [Moorea sp. SIO1F2]|uniref:hypothetical protein n=1 Tax=Moorena sp. SIO1F2 TaxID=2607819 RepID=UPI0013B63FD0|nr:hypothetical protein [Moorena sp. SIO1F2]NET80690.1 hypothetical protein [Moorena sp. SIO1F2]